MRDDEKQKELEITNSGSKTIPFQHRRLINQVQAKEFINPGGPPVFKLHFWGGQWRLINRAGLINPDLTSMYMNAFYISKQKTFYLNPKKMQIQRQ
jgi:hypothetical protein